MKALTRQAFKGSPFGTDVFTPKNPTQYTKKKNKLIPKGLVEPVVVLSEAPCHRQREAENKRVPIFRPKCSNRSVEKEYTEMEGRLFLKFLSECSVSGTWSLTPKTGVDLEKPKCV